MNDLKKIFASLVVVFVFSLPAAQGAELFQDEQQLAPEAGGQPIRVQVVEPENPDFRHRISFGPIGLLLGVGNFAWEMEIVRRFSLELSPMGIYFGFGSDKIYGGTFGVGGVLYISGNAPEGLRLSFAVAPGAIVADPSEEGADTESAFIFGARLMFGYNWVWRSGFTLGLSGGAQYFHFDVKGVDSAFNGILPAIDFNLGFCF